jgi:hypothetical protein
MIAYLFGERNLHRYQQKIAALILAHIKVSVPQNPAFVVACKNEGFRNPVCQRDGNNLIFRVPTYLESKFGKYVESKIGGLPGQINPLPVLATNYQCPIVCETWIF